MRTFILTPSFDNGVAWGVEKPAIAKCKWVAVQIPILQFSGIISCFTVVYYESDHNHSGMYGIGVVVVSILTLIAWVRGTLKYDYV